MASSRNWGPLPPVRSFQVLTDHVLRESDLAGMSPSFFLGTDTPEQTFRFFYGYTPGPEDLENVTLTVRYLRPEPDSTWTDFEDWELAQILLVHVRRMHVEYEANGSSDAFLVLLDEVCQIANSIGSSQN